MWIFKSGYEDFYKIYLPGIIGLSLASFFSYNELNILIYLLIFHCFDVGHLYATLLRTIFNKKEIKENISTFIIPISIAVISFIWLYFKIPYYWYFYILLTVFHNLRQGWGLVRWYEKKNKTYHKNEWFYYALTILPFIIFHLKTGQENLIYYNPKDFDFYNILKFSAELSLFNNFLHIENVLYTLIYVLYVLSLSAWLIKEIIYGIKNKIEYNRIMAMIYFGSVYAYAFLYAKSEFQISVLLIMSHALPYIFIINKSLNYQIQSQYKKIFFLISIIIIGGATNLWIEDFYELESIFNYTKTEISAFEYLVTLLYVTPIFAHYFYDFYLWRKDRPDNKELYNEQ